MMSIILALLLLFSPDGSDKAGRGKRVSEQRHAQPVKQTTLSVTGNTPQPSNVNNEAPAINRRTTPAVTNVSQGITGIYAEEVIYGDTANKHITEPVGTLKWQP